MPLRKPNTGKRQAIGTLSASNGFYQINSLAFTPSKVIIKYRGGSNDSSAYIIMSNTNDLNTYWEAGGDDMVKSTRYSSGSGVSASEFDGNNAIVVNGFKVFVGNGTINYWAYE